MTQIAYLLVVVGTVVGSLFGYIFASRVAKKSVVEAEVAISESQRLKEELEKYEHNEETLNNHVRTQEIELGKVESKNESLEKETQRLISELSEAIASKDNAIAEKSEANNVKTKAVTAMESIQKQYHQTLADLNTTKNNLESAQRNLSELEVATSSLGAKAEADKDALDSITAELAQLKEEYKNALAQRNSGKEKVVELETANAALLKANILSEKIISELKSEIVELRSSIESNEESLSNFKSSLSENKANLNSVSRERNELRELSDTLSEKLTIIESEKNVAVQKTVELETDLEAKNSRIEDVQQGHRESKLELEELKKELAENRKNNTSLKAKLGEIEAKLHSASEQYNDTKIALQALMDKHAKTTDERNEYKETLTSLQNEHATKQEHYAEQMKLLQESKAELKKEFENLAHEILDRKGKAFKELNTESMSKILNPIHEELKGFKSKVEDIHSKESEQRVQLRTELENMQKLNREITDQADKLTTALKGQKKVQGNWGELMLENVLDNAGLRLGTDYQREVSFDTDEGKRRPDVVVSLPQQKHLVIDAKTSLNAYTRFVNSDNQHEREIALSDHTKAIRDRLNELADKDYWKLPGLNSPEVVVMFIPIESAYVEALKADESLFQTALEQNILIATPTTLLTSLNIVRQLWRFEEQNKHTAELANRAEKFYAKLNTFLISMNKVGKQLDSAKDTYDKAFGQLYTGKGNLIKQAAEFKELGVSVKNELPPQLVDKASLELGTEYFDDYVIESSELVSTEKAVN